MTLRGLSKHNVFMNVMILCQTSCEDKIASEVRIKKNKDATKVVISFQKLAKNTTEKETKTEQIQIQIREVKVGFLCTTNVLQVSEAGFVRFEWGHRLRWER